MESRAGSTKNIYHALKVEDKFIVGLLSEFSSLNMIDVGHYTIRIGVKFVSYHLNSIFIKKISKKNPARIKFAKCYEKLGSGAFGLALKSNETYEVLSRSTYSVKLKGDNKAEVYKIFYDRTDQQLCLYRKTNSAGDVIASMKRSFIVHEYMMMRLLSDYFQPKMIAENILKMRFFPGVPLSEILENRIINNSMVVKLHLCLKILEAVKYFHQKIIHRDIKPGNVLVSGVGMFSDAPFRPSDLEVFLIDPGLSKNLEMNTSGVAVGSPLYASPECFSEKNVDEYTDVFSLGRMFWQIWFGVDILDTFFEGDILKIKSSMMPDISGMLSGNENDNEKYIIERVYRILGYMNLPIEKRVNIDACIGTFSHLIKLHHSPLILLSDSLCDDSPAAAAASPRIR